jgi:hypothetical protein
LEDLIKYDGRLSPGYAKSTEDDLRNALVAPMLIPVARMLTESKEPLHAGGPGGAAHNEDK